MMDYVQAWLPAIIGFLGIIIALVIARAKPEMVDLARVLGDAEEYIGEGAEIISEGAEFIQEIAPAAKEFVKGARQYYLTGELELEELKPRVMAQMRELFPHVEVERLEMAVEGAVFAVKLVAREAWNRTKEAPAKDESTPDLTGYAPA